MEELLVRNIFCFIETSLISPLRTWQKAMASEIMRLEQKVKGFDPSHQPKSPAFFQTAKSLQVNLDKLPDITIAASPTPPTPTVTLSSHASAINLATSSSVPSSPHGPSHDAGKRESVKLEEKKDKKHKDWQTTELISFKRTFKPAFAKKQGTLRQLRIVKQSSHQMFVCSQTWTEEVVLFLKF